MVSCLLLGLLLLILAICHLEGELTVNETATEIQAILNGVAKLPCNLTVNNDHATLVMWYRLDTESPIYSLDIRGRNLASAVHWSNGKIFADRAFFSVLNENDGRLVIESITEADSGRYKCRVDFRKNPTRNSYVNLTVIVPPKRVWIVDDLGVPVTRPLVGPYSEGANVNLVCVSEGGYPYPSVTWWLNGELFDDSEALSSEPGYVENELILENIGRSHAGQVYTCQASNNPFSDPVIADVKIDMYLKVLEVKLLGGNLSVSAGSEYEITCQAIGSRPPATITWWKAGQMLEQTRETIYPDGNVTESILTLIPTMEDLGKSLSCRGSNSKVPGSAREDTRTLDVRYKPIVKLTLGSNINSNGIREGMDVYMECTVKANPWFHKLHWKHQDRILTNNATAGTIIANQTLVLQSITRNSSGFYTCVATNSDGTGESNSFRLDVKYYPECRKGQQVIYGAARNEVVSISCEVDANPPASFFRWSFNNSSTRGREIDKFKTEAEGGRSTAEYSPENGYGTLLCFGRNALGPQIVPCAFHVVPAGKPDAPRNCSLHNRTQTALSISCSRGFDGGLPQVFTLELYAYNGRLVANQTSRINPQFTVGSLEPGETYMVNIYSQNAKGRSSSVISVQVNTLRPTQQEHRRNLPTPIPTRSFLTSSNFLLWIFIGVATGVTLVGFLLVIAWKFRTLPTNLVPCFGENDEDRSTQHSNSGTESDEPKLMVHLPGGPGSLGLPIIKPIHQPIIGGQEGLEMDERNPDVIPYQNDAEQANRSDSVEIESNSRSWRSTSDLHVLPADQPFQHRPLTKLNSSQCDLGPHIIWNKTSGSSSEPPPYNLILGKQNLMLVDAATQGPLVLTTVPADVALNPCILSVIPEHGAGPYLHMVSSYSKPSLQQHAGTQTSTHKESAV